MLALRCGTERRTVVEPIGIRQAARLLNCRTSTVRRLAQGRRLIARGAGRRLVVCAQSVRAYRDEVEWRRKLDIKGVYVIHAPEVGRYKIGFASSISVRVRLIQSSSPCLLVIAAVLPGRTREFEGRLHRRFASSRLHGEWFAETPELVEFCRLSMAGSTLADKGYLPPILTPSP